MFFNTPLTFGGSGCSTRACYTKEFGYTTYESFWPVDYDYHQF